MTPFDFTLFGFLGIWASMVTVVAFVFGLRMRDLNKCVEDKNERISNLQRHLRQANSRSHKIRLALTEAKDEDHLGRIAKINDGE